MNPRISIVIPTYGRALYLKNLIESIRATTPKGLYEIIIVSSDSPDSEKVGWLKQQHDIQTILEDNRGSGPRKKSLYYYTNVGIKAAKNEWVFVVNDDMVFEKNWYEALTETLSKPEHKNAGLIIVATQLGDVRLGHRFQTFGRTKKGNGPWKDLYICDISLIRRDVLKQIGYFDEQLDWYGSGADNSLAIEFLTDTDTVIGKNIRINHYIADELRTVNAGDAFNDFKYIKTKWSKWCAQNDCECEIHLDDRPSFFTALKSSLKNKFRSWPLYTTLKTLYFYPQFKEDFETFKTKSTDGRFEVRWTDRQWSPYDKTAFTGFDRHYIYHPAWAARVLAQTKPKLHVDISSTLAFCAIASAFVPIDFYDYRPADIQLSNLQSKKADLMKLPFTSNSVDSLSCMHTVEHIGLGRYGDPLDPEGDLKAIKELKRILARDGSLLFVTPIGKTPTLKFNTHRIYSYDQIMDYFRDLRLQEFTLIPEKGGAPIQHATKADTEKEIYACGCFWFKKP